MSGGTFAACYWCRRLLIRGQRCVCREIPAMSCDCAFDGNRQIIGPECRKRISQAWSMAVNGR